jgi:hypothetical protein
MVDYDSKLNDNIFTIISLLEYNNSILIENKLSKYTYDINDLQFLNFIKCEFLNNSSLFFKNSSRYNARNETNTIDGIAILECKSEYTYNDISDTESTNLYSDDEEESKSNGSPDIIAGPNTNGIYSSYRTDSEIFFDSKDKFESESSFESNSDSYSDEYLNDYNSNIDSDEFKFNDNSSMLSNIEQQNKNYYPLRLSNTNTTSASGNNNSEYNEEDDDKYNNESEYNEENNNINVNDDSFDNLHNYSDLNYREDTGLKYILENDYHIFYQYIKKIELLKTSNFKQYNKMNEKCIILNLKNIQNAFFDLMELYT